MDYDDNAAKSGEEYQIIIFIRWRFTKWFEQTTKNLLYLKLYSIINLVRNIPLPSKSF